MGMKSTIVDPAPPRLDAGIPEESSMGPAKHLTRVGRLSTWKWGIAACLCLTISGGVRYYRDQQFQGLAELASVAPFGLNELPKQFGSWRAVEGTDSQLDPEIARIAGSTDHILRSYLDVKSGQTVSVMVLYGPSDQAFAHTPEFCYPSAGFQAVMDPVDHPFAVGEPKIQGSYRGGFYSKSTGGITQYVEVLHSFRHGKEWLGDLASKWKSFRVLPATFKIQIQRLTTDLSTEASPSEPLLLEMIQWVEKRVREQQKI